MGNVPWNNICEKSFGILFLKQCCASPSEVSSLPLETRARRGTHCYAKVTHGLKLATLANSFAELESGQI